MIWKKLWPWRATKKYTKGEQQKGQPASQLATYVWRKTKLSFSQNLQSEHDKDCIYDGENSSQYLMWD